MPYYAYHTETRLSLDPVENEREGRLPSEEAVMRLAVLMVIAFVLYGCATTEEGKQIIPDQVTWIQKGRTTRPEVIARFGSPPVEFPQSSGFTTTSTTTTRTTTDSEGHIKTIQTTTQIQRPTSLRKATYAYTRREPARFPFYDNGQWTQSQFWVVYDERGIVQDYGFLGDLPITRQVAVTAVRSAYGNVADLDVEGQQAVATSEVVDNALEDPHEP